MEVYRPARTHAGGHAARGRPRRRSEGVRPQCRRDAGLDRRTPPGLRRRHLRSRSVRSRRPRGGPEHRFACAGAGGRRSRSRRAARQGGADRGCRSRAQHRIHGRRRPDPGRGRGGPRAAGSPGFLQCRRGPRRGVHALVRAHRGWRPSHAGRKPPGVGRASGEQRARAGRRRPRPCRSRQDHGRGGRRPARLQPDGGDRCTRALQ